MKATSKYAVRRKANGGDNYGSWRNGEQLKSERINGVTLTYNHRTGEWR